MSSITRGRKRYKQNRSIKIWFVYRVQRLKIQWSVSGIFVQRFISRFMNEFQYLVSKISSKLIRTGLEFKETAWKRGKTLWKESQTLITRFLGAEHDKHIRFWWIDFACTFFDRALWSSLIINEALHPRIWLRFFPNLNHRSVWWWATSWNDMH